jgi:hypothetical protein
VTKKARHILPLFVFLLFSPMALANPSAATVLEVQSRIQTEVQSIVQKFDPAGLAVVKVKPAMVTERARSPSPMM